MKPGAQSSAWSLLSQGGPDTGYQGIQPVASMTSTLSLWNWKMKHPMSARLPKQVSDHDQPNCMLWVRIQPICTVGAGGEELV